MSTNDKRPTSIPIEAPSIIDCNIGGGGLCRMIKGINESTTINAIVKPIMLVNI
jgi:hypothetical protein